MKSDGSVVTWGNEPDGGSSSNVAGQLRSGVTQIYSTGQAFAALKSDGSVVTWGFFYGVAPVRLSGVVSFADPFSDDRLSSNRPPVIAGVSLGSAAASSGALTGTVKASDPDGDKLTYTATTSAKGAVTITAAGVFTYTPTAAARHAAAKNGAAAALKSDSVTVTVTDAQGAVTTQAVAVAISPANSVPAGARATVGAPTASVGAVSGTVSATDADKDPLTYSVGTKPAKGSVTINATTGAFTYTPTIPARQNAAKAGATAADKADTFTVAISDGFGGSATLSVRVAVSPMSYLAGHVKRNPATGEVALRTQFAEATDPGKGWLVISASSTTSRYAPTSEVQSWVDLFVPA